MARLVGGPLRVHLEMTMSDVPEPDVPEDEEPDDDDADEEPEAG